MGADGIGASVLGHLSLAEQGSLGKREPLTGESGEERAGDHMHVCSSANRGAQSSDIEEAGQQVRGCQAR